MRDNVHTLSRYTLSTSPLFYGQEEESQEDKEAKGDEKEAALVALRSLQASRHVHNKGGALSLRRLLMLRFRGHGKFLLRQERELFAQIIQ